MQRRPRTRVLITGIGMLTPLGPDARSTWSALLAGRSVVAPLVEAPLYFGARVSASEYARATADHPNVPRTSALALVAASEAMADAGLSSPLESDRAGVSLGCAMPPMVEFERVVTQIPRRVQPRFIARILPSAPASCLSIAHGLRGPSFASASACASGAHAIADAAAAIWSGEADLMVAGGTDASLSPITIAGFARARALATHGAGSPAIFRGPFDRGRCGFAIGEGAAVVVLESQAHWMARSPANRPYAQILGFGRTADAFHDTAPDPEARGEIAAMQRAIAIAGRLPDVVIAHATATPIGDRAEAHAIATAAPKAVIAATKGALGHLLGAAPALDLAVAALVMRDQRVPPIAALHVWDPDLPIAQNGARPRHIDSVICNAFSFGGSCVAIQIGNVAVP